MIRTRPAFLAALAAVTAISGCVPRAEERRASPQAAVIGIIEPARAYRDMGLLAQDAQLPFVAAIRFLAGPTPDSTLVLFSISLANRALWFQRFHAEYRAGYHVDGVFEAGALRREIASDETVHVPTIAETVREDESVVFQQFVLLPPGDVSVAVALRDLGNSHASRLEGSVHVPRLGQPAIAMIPVYRGKGRTTRGALPDLVANPRAAASFVADTLDLYIEAYGAAPRAVTLRAVDDEGNEVWRLAPEMSGDSALRTAFVQFTPGVLPLGRLRIDGVLEGAPDTARTFVLTGYSDHLMVADFDGTLALLRYAGEDARLSQLRAAPRSGRAAAWRWFWVDSDPSPETPDNERLSRYFTLLRDANARFTEGDAPGWLTDRGEVQLSLGEADEEAEMASNAPGPMQVDKSRCRMNCPSIWWKYKNPLMGFVFVYDPAVGRFRLDPSSRREFEKVMAGRRKGRSAGLSSP